MFADTGHSANSSGRPFPAANTAHDAATAAARIVPYNDFILPFLF
jgi:hypothetical protein